jgi:hypothetical protein
METVMKTRNVTVPELGLIAGTRAMIGFGAGLLLADKFRPEEKRAIGWILLGVGLFITVPLAAEVFLEPEANGRKNGRGSDGARARENEMAASGA